MCFVLRLIPKPFPSGKQSCTRSFLRSFPQDICCHHAVAQVGSKEEKALLRVGAATVVSTTVVAGPSSDPGGLVRVLLPIRISAVSCLHGHGRG